MPIEEVRPEQAMRDIQATHDWVAIDLIQKRYLSGTAGQPVGRDACFAMHVDEHGNQSEPLSVHFAPWWELHEQVDPCLLDQPRATPIDIPYIDREFLFGEPLLLGLAQRVVKLAGTERGRAAIGSTKRNDLYQLTVEVHRDWLMTPHEAIDDRHPRQLLHGGMAWIEKLAWAQRLRFDSGNEKVVALPKEIVSYQSSPMGREEMVMYFDLCRELIDSSWQWCQQARQSDQVQRLVEHLRTVKSAWLAAPFEGGSPPAFIVECCRRRVPRGAGVEIVGMADRQTEAHVIDCDCPICLAMADGLFGVSFAGIDGHHLELDNEFAFSMHETREAWEEEQSEFAEMSASFDAQRLERQASADDEPQEFASAWAGVVSDEPLAGDSTGNMKLTFLLAEVVAELERDQADHALIDQINAAFTAFRTVDVTDSAQTQATHCQLVEALESIAEQHPRLTSRIADFQSRVQKQLRARC